MTHSNEPNANELKELGNEAAKNQKYELAVLHYTHAIKLDPRNYTLYSNRSFAFLKMQQYYHALQDANETINLNPNWAKSYFRKGEVEFVTHHFLDACISYQRALQLQPDDPTIIQALSKADHERRKDIKADQQIPWLGAGIGIVFGVIIVIGDSVHTSQPTHPILMAFATIGIAVFGYVIGRLVRYYIKCQRDALIQPPADLLETEDSSNDDQGSKSATPRYTKSQARQRYRKGKL